VAFPADVVGASEVLAATAALGASGVGEASTDASEPGEIARETDADAEIRPDTVARPLAPPLVGALAGRVCEGCGCCD
jgi:hypothetical protein